MSKNKIIIIVTTLCIIFLVVGFFVFNNINPSTVNNQNVNKNTVNSISSSLLKNIISSTNTSTKVSQKSEFPESEQNVSIISSPISSSKNEIKNIDEKPISIPKENFISPETKSINLIEKYQPEVKTTFQDTTKLIVTNVIIPESIPKNIFVETSFTNPNITKAKFYATNISEQIEYLGEGITGIYEINFKGQIYKLVLAEDETGYVSTYIFKNNFESPKLVNFNLENEFAVGSVQKKSDTVFLIKAYKGQDLVVFKDIEVDISQIIDQQYNSPESQAK